MISFGSHWAHAHDTEQILFMTFAAEFLDQSRFRSSEWLQTWKTYWEHHKRAHGNGCSDIDLEGNLSSSAKVQEFREFLDEYNEVLPLFSWAGCFRLANAC